MDLSTAPDFRLAYGFPRGFSFRREPFGGILYHYEGIKPDPRVTFIDNRFLIDLLERVDDGPLEDLIAAVTTHFSLPSAEEATIRTFFAALIKRGALVDRAIAQASGCEACGLPETATTSAEQASR
jgi:putative mycofactocin binding protein MftB